MDYHGGLLLKYPGGRQTPDNPFGLGMGVMAFLSWETQSGRLDPHAGSDWWKQVNGMMTLDMQTAMNDIATGRKPQSKAIAAWVSYAKASENGTATQAMFWEAHQISLHQALAFAPEIMIKNKTERILVEQAMKLVDLSAIGTKASDNGKIASITRGSYPDHYPARPGDVKPLIVERRAAQLASKFPGVTSMTSNTLPSVPETSIGINSHRWKWS